MTNSPKKVARKVRSLTTGREEQRGQISTEVFGQSVTWYVIRQERRVSSWLPFRPFFKNYVYVEVGDGDPARVDLSIFVGEVEADMIVRATMDVYREHNDIGDPTTWNELIEEFDASLSEARQDREGS